MTGYGGGYGHQQDDRRSGGYENQFDQAYGYQGGYGQAGPGAHNPYAQGDGVMPPKKGSTKGPKTLTFIGLGLLAVAVVAIIISAVAIGRFVQSADIESAGAGGTQIEAEAGQDWALYATGESAPEARTQTCRVVGPDGTEVSLSNPSTDVTINDYSLGHRFTTPQAGTYTVTCSVDAFVGQDVGAGQVFASIGGIIFGVFGAIGGFVLAVSGGIWWIARRS